MSSTTTSSRGGLGSLHDVPAVRNLDDPLVLHESLRQIRSHSAHNFVVTFDERDATVAFSVDASACEAFLDGEPDQASATRWINIWYPSRQPQLLESLARRYDFSPRLLAFIVSDPMQLRRSKTQTTSSRPSTRWRWHRRPQTASDVDKLEQGSDDGEGDDEISQHSYMSTDDNARVNIYWLLRDVWHYSTVDFGRNYVCVGFNTIYGIKHTGQERGNGPLPHCLRVWTWLVVCDDHTVIAIHEDPFPHLPPGATLTPLQHRILVETRRNQISVFRSLSHASPSPLNASNPMLVLPIRLRLGDTPAETLHRAADAPGLLFYYLFENWQTSYTLVTRRESRYDIELASLRAEMFARPRLAQLDRLDSIGKELGVLRRHYESYVRIINRLLEPIPSSRASLLSSRVVASNQAHSRSASRNSSSSSLSTIRPAAHTLPTPDQRESNSCLGVPFTSAARVRFKRFRDMIDQYALSEVQEQLRQKESLVTMNFSLIAIHQSTDVDRLTRLTLLLTKATILFLPVSLMTSYFSVNLVDVQYGLKEFWVAFAGVFVASAAALGVLGVFAESVRSRDVWRAVVAWTAGERDGS